MPAAVVLVGTLAFMFAYAGLLGYRLSFKPLLIALADAFDAVSIGVWRASGRPLAPVAAAIRRLAAAIERGFEWMVARFEAPAVWLWEVTGGRIAQTGETLASFATATAQTIYRLRTVDIPLAVRVALAPVTGGLTLAQSALHTLTVATIPAIYRRVGAAERATEAQAARLRAGIDRIGRIVTRTIPATIGAVIGSLGALERRVGSQAGRLSHLEKVTVGVGAAALVGTALGRLGLRWIRCPNVGRLGKRACAMDNQLLEDLLAGTLAIVGTVSLIEATKDMQAIVEQVVDFERALIREL